ncbi:MAG: C25 family cysteine peptidase [Candidatus Thorarchaeota archaeon]
MRVSKIAFCLLLAGLFSRALMAEPRAEVLQHTYEFQAPQWTPSPWFEGLEIPTIEGARTLARSGEPLLPVYPARILLPPGENVVSIDVEVLTAPVRSFHKPAPGQPEYPFSFEGPIPLVQPNKDLYSRSDLYPEESASLVTVQSYRGFQIAYIDLFPLRVRLSAGVAEFSPRIRLVIRTEPDEQMLARTSKTFRGLLRDEYWVRSNVDNPEMIAAYQTAYREGLITHPRYLPRGICDPSDTYLYVIITSSSMMEAFEPLAQDRTRKGLPAVIVDVQDILSNYTGRDNQERIRNFILDAYQNWETEYILFGGDVNTIPDRDCYCYIIDEGNPMETNNLCCELYYQGLDGTWNDDDDDRWGEEEEADLVAEVHIGRSCSDDASDAEAFVTKVLRYENEPVVDEVESASLFGEYLWEGTWGGMYMEEIRLGSDSWGFHTEGIPQDWDVTTHYEMDGSWSGSTFINQMNSGTHMAHHLGHSNSSYNIKVYISDIPSFTNDGITHTYGFGYSQGCDAGMFDETD